MAITKVRFLAIVSVFVVVSQEKNRFHDIYQVFQKYEKINQTFTLYYFILCSRSDMFRFYSTIIRDPC